MFNLKFKRNFEPSIKPKICVAESRPLLRRLRLQSRHTTVVHGLLYFIYDKKSPNISLNWILNMLQAFVIIFSQGLFYSKTPLYPIQSSDGHGTRFLLYCFLIRVSKISKHNVKTQIRLNNTCLVLFINYRTFYYDKKSDFYL